MSHQDSDPVEAALRRGDPDALLDALEDALEGDAAAPSEPPPAPSCDLPPDPSLTARQDAFCDAYAETGNAAESARQAGYAPGSARVTGSRLLTNANILERIEKLRAVRNRARDADRHLLLKRLEATWQAAQAAGRFNAALGCLKLMAQLGGLTGADAQRHTESADLDSAATAGPLRRAAVAAEQDRAAEAAAARHRADQAAAPPADLPLSFPEQQALIQTEWRRLARARPGGLPAGQVPGVTAFMGSAGLYPPPDSAAAGGGACGPSADTAR